MCPGSNRGCRGSRGRWVTAVALVAAPNSASGVCVSVMCLSLSEWRCRPTFDSCSRCDRPASAACQLANEAFWRLLHFLFASVSPPLLDRCDFWSFEKASEKARTIWRDVMCFGFVSLGRRRINPENPTSEVPGECSAPAFLRKRGRNPNAASRHIPAEHVPAGRDWSGIVCAALNAPSRRRAAIKP